MDSQNETSHPLSIDWKQSIALASNDKELAKDLLKAFVLTILPQASEAIHIAYEQRNHPELLSQVHRLHGAACYCGVSRLKQLIERMESTLRECPKEKLDGQFDALLHDFDEEINTVVTAYKIGSIQWMEA